MDTPERHRPVNAPPDATDAPDAPDAPDAQGGDGLERMRRRGDEFLSAGDSAIEGVLSSDSVGFLKHVRQTGGQ